MPEFERHGHGEGLERRAHLVNAGGQPVDARRIERFARIIRIVVRLRDQRDDLAGAHIEHEAGGGERVEFCPRGDEFVAQRVLDAQIDGELHRRLQPVGGEAGQVQGRKALPVEPFLDSGDALIVDIDVTDQMRDFVAVRVVALVLLEETDARYSLPVDFALLFRRDVALEPDEAALGRQPLAQLLGVEIGQVGGQKLDRLVDVDQPARFGIERRHPHVGRQDLAIAVEDVGSRRGHGIARHHAMGRVLVGLDREHDQPCRDDGVDESEGDNGQPDAGPRFGAAVEVFAVEQLADEPLPPGDFARANRRGLPICVRGCAHRSDAPEAAGTWLVPPGTAAAGGIVPVVSNFPDSSKFSIMPPIGSAPATAFCGGRSGK